MHIFPSQPSLPTHPCLQPESGRLWACLIGTYWVGLGAIYFLWTNYVCVVTLRARSYAVMGGALLCKQYATLVRDIPAGRGEDKEADAMQDLFGRIYGPSFIGAQRVFDSNKVRGTGHSLTFL